MTSSYQFYEQLPSFKDFKLVFEGSNYRRVPDDWWVVITDVSGSTKAISEGRYKEVNLVGAASIIAVVNALENQAIPYVFGGDGATILLHDRDIAKIKPVLIATKAMAKQVFDLEIRAGAVPVAQLSSEGKYVELAKYQLSDTATLAMIRGGGVNLAEKLVKRDDTFSIKSENPSGESQANLNGLSCRWSPIPSKRGEVVSILVMARDVQTNSSDQIYRQVLEGIEQILGDHHDSYPVTFDGLAKRKMSWKSILNEVRMQANGRDWLGKVGAALWVAITFSIVNLFIMLGLKSPITDTEKYVKEVSEGSDFRKFDDTLRMVRDCTAEQRWQIEDMLKGLYLKGLIFYGTYSSSHSLMTCYVASFSSHVHFIDGSDGGYAMAAKGMKQQIQAANEKNLATLK